MKSPVIVGATDHEEGQGFGYKQPSYLTVEVTDNECFDELEYFWQVYVETSNDPYLMSETTNWTSPYDTAEVDYNGAQIAKEFIVYQFFTDENSLAIETSNLGVFYYKVGVSGWKQFDVEGEDEKCWYDTEYVWSETCVYRVIDRLVDKISVSGIQQPIIGETPSTANIKATPYYDGDEYVGYEILSKRWVNSPAKFEDNDTYTLEVVLKAKEHCAFAAAADIEATFNSLDGVNFYTSWMKGMQLATPFTVGPYTAMTVMPLESRLRT